MDLLFGTFGEGADYAMFAVDDIIVTDELDVKEGIRKLQETAAYGLYYRLGKHIDFSWIANFYQGIPLLQDVGNDYFVWQFNTGRGDWRYPNTVDLALYRKDQFQKDFQTIDFTYPNELEGYWAVRADINKVGLCYKRAKMVNIPLNIVTQDRNRATHLFSAEELNKFFMQGMKIDINPFYHICNNSPHGDYIPQFVNRE